MTFRERLADWISGGAVSVYREGAEYWKGECRRACEKLGEERAKYTKLRVELHRLARGEE